MRRLLDALFPRFCLACAARVRDLEPTLGLCRDCAARLPRLAGRPRCARCAEPVASGEICGACAVAPPPWERCVALFLYAGPVPPVLHGFKFRRLEYLGEELGRRLGEAWLDRRALDLPDRVTPMPLPWPRRLARGFNQTESMASALGRTIGRPARRLLWRRPTWGSQTGRGRRARLRLGAAREAGAEFRRLPLQRLAGERILLVDDVLTTGATARAAAQALLAAGARRVDLAVAARTPRTHLPEAV